MVAVGNRVLLGRVDHSLFSHVDLGFFVASALEPSMFTGSSEHRAHSNALLALCFLLDGVQENCFHPCWDCRVRIGNFCQDSMPQRLEGGTSVDFCDTSNLPDESYPPRGSVERN